MKLEDVIQNPRLVSIDTRTIKEGDVFLAIKGARFDGHDFAEEAFARGAKTAIVSRMPKLSSANKSRLIMVKDTARALGDIAKIHRSKFSIPVVAITGTNGKTTAKDMTAHVLAAKYRVLKNETSKNNHIGLPLTLLRLEERHDIAVLEMGMNHPGEINRLCAIAKPRIGAITNIGPSHLEFLGTLENVFIAKFELLKRLSRQGAAVLNKDDPYLRNIKNIKPERVYFGIKQKCRFRAGSLRHGEKALFFSVSESPDKKSGKGKGKKENFELALYGKHNIYNALVAISVARLFGIDFQTIRERIKSYRQNCRMRLEFKGIGGVRIFDDSYNSNPLSMECAIDTLVKYDTRGKRIIVSADMLELGKKAKSMHAKIGRLIASNPVDTLITLGDLSAHMGRAAKAEGMRNIFHAQSHAEAANFLRKLAKPGDAVLVKGSRAMSMERVVEEFGRGYRGIGVSGDQRAGK